MSIHYDNDRRDMTPKTLHFLIESYKHIRFENLVKKFIFDPSKIENLYLMLLKPATGFSKKNIDI